MRRRPLSALLVPPLQPLLISLSLLLTTPAPARADGCTAAAGLSTCFDVNTLWLPAGRAYFATLADTQSTAVGQFAFGVAGEYLHQPLNLHVASPDRAGREVRVLSDAVDTSYFLALGLVPQLELTLATSIRSYQRGAGAGGVSSQTSAPLATSAVRRPRVGLGYSLDDAIGRPGIGLRLGLDAAIPTGNDDAFAGERSLVVMPSTTFALQFGRLHLTTMLGARLRRALEFGGVRLGNQAYVGLGLGYDLLAPGLLSLGLEAFALPALSASRADTANARVSDARLLSAEWLASVQSSLGPSGPWTIRLAAGGGLPFSSETRATSSGPRELHFLGLGTPDFRSLLVLRYLAPAQP